MWKGRNDGNKQSLPVVETPTQEEDLTPTGMWGNHHVVVSQMKGLSFEPSHLAQFWAMRVPI